MDILSLISHRQEILPVVYTNKIFTVSGSLSLPYSTITTITNESYVTFTPPYRSRRIIISCSEGLEFMTKGLHTWSSVPIENRVK